ncbi:MAG TPA: protein-disulfide reductase DsbD domain-containing protein [Pyrinomonadaceae bacterium]|nr:protein-disulfide reductase DsbD domain-containing protein [Pyrinomonadaceae bacterium]
MNRSFLVALCLALAFVLEGCTHGIHSGTGGWPPASASSPVSISSSADVVKVRAADVSIPAGGNADATVTLSISPGYHINANPATFSYLIATEVRQVPAPDGICVVTGKIVYPAGINKKFAFAEKPLAVYEGEVVIKLPLHVPRPGEGGCYGYLTKGAHDSLPINVKVQACDNEKCYSPATLDATITVNVK